MSPEGEEGSGQRLGSGGLPARRPRPSSDGQALNRGTCLGPVRPPSRRVGPAPRGSSTRTQRPWCWHRIDFGLSPRCLPSHSQAGPELEGGRRRLLSPTRPQPLVSPQASGLARVPRLRQEPLASTKADSASVACCPPSPNLHSLARPPLCLCRRGHDTGLRACLHQCKKEDLGRKEFGDVALPEGCCAGELRAGAEREESSSAGVPGPCRGGGLAAEALMGRQAPSPGLCEARQSLGSSSEAWELPGWGG